MREPKRNMALLVLWATSRLLRQEDGNYVAEPGSAGAAASNRRRRRDSGRATPPAIKPSSSTRVEQLIGGGIFAALMVNLLISAS
jgi:hypothetical protein